MEKLTKNKWGSTLSGMLMSQRKSFRNLNLFPCVDQRKNPFCFKAHPYFDEHAPRPPSIPPCCDWLASGLQRIVTANRTAGGRDLYGIRVGSAVW